ncbi:hypothetical protein L6164_020479 [Bauhinia variegata]|nr:hypothetical protein L6164_020479 [Bauhinia variegata]
MEFQGFIVNPIGPPLRSPRIENHLRNVEACLLPEAAVVAAGRGYETYVAVLKLKAPPSPSLNGARRISKTLASRAPIDLVTVLDVGGTMTGPKLQMMKRSMRLVISSLRSADRLSIIAFSSGSKRLLPLRRMTSNGQRSARRIVDALVAIDQSREGTSVKNDAVKKAAKVLQDRREKNPVATIIVLSDGQDKRIATTSPNPECSIVSPTRFSHIEFPVYSVGFPDGSPCAYAQPDDVFAKCVDGLLTVVAQDLKLQLGIISRSLPAEIAGVYSLAGRPSALSSGSVRLGDLYAEEERELLVELRVPAASAGSPHAMSVRSCYRDPSTQELVYSKEQALLIPRPHAVRSSDPKIQRLRNLHITTRAVAECRRLAEHNDLSGAHHLLSSARALLMQSSPKLVEEHLRCLEGEQAELQRRRQQQHQSQGRRSNRVEKLEPLTPTSAWRAAERLAKVAIMRKSMNRVSDLHGFENARF